MSMFAWWKKAQNRDASPLSGPIEAEKRERQAELAQVVVTFERRRHNVQKIAEQALQSMREGHRR